MNNKKLKRFIEIDIWRSLAVISMIIFHYIAVKDYYEIQDVPIYEGAWLIFARFIQWSFLLLVGISLQLSYQKAIHFGRGKKGFLSKNIKRGLFVLSCGMLITLITWIFIPDQFVFFGILHLIGLSIILLSFIAGRPVLSLLLAAFIYMASIPINEYVLSSKWMAIFGFNVENIQSLDLFSIFPWLAVPALGIFLGSTLFQNYERRFSIPANLENSPIIEKVSFFSKKALLIYMLHIPVLAGIFLLFQYLGDWFK